jgi:hypothetical protein
MKIENVRIGFASNSSSTHSLVIWPDATDYDWEEGEFGWGDFRCKSNEAKMLYLGTQLKENLECWGLSARQTSTW